MDYGLLPATPDLGQEKPSTSKKRKRRDADGGSCEDSSVVGSGTEEKMDDEKNEKRKQKKMKKKKKKGELKKENGELVAEQVSGTCFSLIVRLIIQKHLSECGLFSMNLFARILLNFLEHY